MARIKSVIFGALLPGVLALPQNSPIDIKLNERASSAPRAEERAAEVINTFRIAWDGYYKYAFPNDELRPVTNGFDNPR